MELYFVNWMSTPTNNLFPLLVTPVLYKWKAFIYGKNLGNVLYIFAISSSIHKLDLHSDGPPIRNTYKRRGKKQVGGTEMNVPAAEQWPKAQEREMLS